MNISSDPVAALTLDALDAYLSSEHSPPESMMLSDLDGFLAGIAVGPELVMPSEWLPVIWGGEEPVFVDADEAQAVLGCILSRYNEILRGLEDGSFEPIFWAIGGITIAADWAEGFLQAISLRMEAWEPLLKSERHVVLIFPILFLCGDENGELPLGLDTQLEDGFMAEAPDILPVCVMEIAAFWRKRRAGRIRTKIGRNEPCPCGSGNKFKKCCG